MIHDEICTYEVAKLAKEKGFNEKCNFYYQKGVISTDGCFNRYNKGVEYICSAPTQSLLQRWLREEKGLHIIIDGGFQWGLEDLQRHFMERDIQVNIGAFGLFDTYEEALEDALKYALENLV